MCFHSNKYCIPIKTKIGNQLILSSFESLNKWNTFINNNACKCHLWINIGVVLFLKMGCIVAPIDWLMIHWPKCSISYFSFQAYHSQISQVNDHLANFALCPIRTQIRGPAPTTNAEDIIDESLYYFKANIFFRNYEIKVMYRIAFEQNIHIFAVNSFFFFHLKLFIISVWCWSCSHLYHPLHNRMFKEIAAMCKQRTSSTRIVFIGNKPIRYSWWCWISVEFSLCKTIISQWSWFTSSIFDSNPSRDWKSFNWKSIHHTGWQTK